ncbi:MAG: hypothetical protein ACLQVM_30935, partial [Terriglobia bacterium]
LYTLARSLHEHRLSIVLSKINTEGTRVADVFYVNELDGSKVAPGARYKEIQEALYRASVGENAKSEVVTQTPWERSKPNSLPPLRRNPG